MDDYVAQALRTESVTKNSRLLHSALGVVSEVGELLLAEPGDKINLKEELGDILWYVAIGADEMGLTFDDLFGEANHSQSEKDPLKMLVTVLSGLADTLKRALFYGLTDALGKFPGHLGSAIYAIALIAGKEGWTLDEVQEANIDKLRRRYPEKFTTEAAVNREDKS